MPGVLIVEALAQVGAVAILSEEGNKGQDGIFRGNQQRKIQEKGSSGRQVKAGVPYHQEKKDRSASGSATATVDGKLAVSAELTFMIG